MSRDQRPILVVLLTLLSSGTFGAALHSWAGIFMGVCMGVAFGLFDPREDDGDGQEGEGQEGR